MLQCGNIVASREIFATAQWLDTKKSQIADQRPNLAGPSVNKRANDREFPGVS